MVSAERGLRVGMPLRLYAVRGPTRGGFGETASAEASPHMYWV